jgi:ubiquinone/menaquinone biosynthesis C-methylase UbiE/uncharacterized protein YbaR (Trm112 family)
MQRQLLDILHCPHCASRMTLTALEENPSEVRRGHLVCAGQLQHLFEIHDGIVRFATGFDHEAVQKELAYENSTYTGSDRLTDPKLIAHFPETLPSLWPHTAHFGPDFTILIDYLDLRSGMWVLDIGTGPCWSSRLLAQRNARVIALDVNDANFYGLGTADLLFAEHGIYFERILESMTRLPFADQSLDRITFNASFHHTPDHEQTLRECFRVLKPGGWLAMVNEEFGSLRQSLFNREATSDTGSHHQIRYADFERAVNATGFGSHYFLAAHVRSQLQKKFSPRLGNWLANAIEHVPFVLKQLNSALILLSKPKRADKVTESETV